MATARDPRALLRRARRRYRRPVAAVLAGLAVVVAISALRPSAAPVDLEAAPTTSLTRPGDVTMPVPLATGGGQVTAGDVVDLVAVDETGSARVVAAQVTVTANSASAGYSSGTVVVIALPPHDALAVAEAADRSALSVLIHPRGLRTG